MKGPAQDSGSPAWMATFADLMSLLVCFFVLLLSFSELDVQKYKQLVGSMKSAFGVQDDVVAESIPKGTSVVAREFSPGTPRPTPSPVMFQQRSPTRDPVSPTTERDREAGERQLEIALEENVQRGDVEVELSPDKITIRIRERGSFPSASAHLDPRFIPVVQGMRAALADIPGTISVEGHTDDIPITSAVFASNWELSSARALSVARELMRDGVLPEQRFMIVGHADTRPLQQNNSAENRAGNRRVEIVIRREEDSEEIPEYNVTD